MTAHDHHDNHHRLIDERADALQRAPRRTGRDKLVRRELEKSAHWTLVGHLRCCHGWKGNSALRSYNELQEIHAKGHA